MGLESRGRLDWSGTRVRYVEATTEAGGHLDGRLLAAVEARSIALQVDRPPADHPAPDTLTFGPGVSVDAQRLLALMALESGLILHTVGPGTRDEGMAVYEFVGATTSPPWTVDALLAVERPSGPVPEELRAAARAGWLVSGLHSSHEHVRRRERNALMGARDLWGLAVDRALVLLDVDVVDSLTWSGRRAVVHFLQELDGAIWTPERVASARAMIAAHRSLAAERPARTVGELVAQGRRPEPEDRFLTSLRILDQRLAGLRASLRDR